MPLQMQASTITDLDFAYLLARSFVRISLGYCEHVD